MNETSLRKLSTAHSDLQTLAHDVDKEYPIQVICGERGEKEQNEAFERKASRLRYPESKHNINPEKGRHCSHAIDAVPDPDKNPNTLDWRDAAAFHKMLDLFEKKAKERRIKIRLGRNFKMRDLPHIELV